MKNYRYNIFYCLLSVLLFISCSHVSLENESDYNKSSSSIYGSVPTKVINSWVIPESGSLIIYMDEASCQDSTGISKDFAAKLDSLGVLSYKRLFDFVPSTEERLRSFGMHRWYLLRLDDQADPKSLAYALSKEVQVLKIQYNVKMHRQICGSPKPCAFSLDSKVRKYSEVPGNSEVFNDAGLSLQWHYYNDGSSKVAPSARKGADINVSDAWRLTAGDPSIIVAVVDEGVKYDHPDLEANMWTNEREKNGISGIDDDGNGYVDDIHGYNFVNHGPVTWDKKGDVGHGTHVAGTVAAVNNNGQGVCGVAGGTGHGDGVKLMSCQILSGEDGGTVDAAANAIRYAADNGASILQCSFGYPPDNFLNDADYQAQVPAELDAIKYFIGKKNCDQIDGGLVVFAAGNEAAAWSDYPGGYTDLISVTALAADNCPAYYTNFGRGCNVAAPGGEYFTGGAQDVSSLVLSTTPEGLVVETDDGSSFVCEKYGYMQGTSMACPHVSGVAALGLSYAKKLGKTYTLEQFKSMLLTSVKDVNRFLSGSKYVFNSFMNLEPFRGKMGTGSVDAWRLLMQIEGTPTLMACINDYNRLSLKEYLGTGAEDITYIGVDISPQDREAIGLKEDPVIKSGRLILYPTRAGAAKLTVRAVGGGTGLGTPEQMGGFEISREISVITREAVSGNGGWL